MSAFTKQVARVTRTARATAKQLSARVALLKHPAVRAAFEAFPPVIRKDVDISLSTYGDSVYMNTTMRNLESFKVPKLTCLLERFMGDEWRARVSEYPNDTPNKDFHFERQVDGCIPCTSTAVSVCGGFTLNVSIFAYVKSDSPLCRVVVTGVTERMVREETKEIVCA